MIIVFQNTTTVLRKKNKAPLMQLQQVFRISTYNLGVNSRLLRISWEFPARHGGTPQKNGGFTMENPAKKWMMTGGSSILGNLHMGLFLKI